jgi:hypothetical protein
MRRTLCDRFFGRRGIFGRHTLRGGIQPVDLAQGAEDTAEEDASQDQKAPAQSEQRVEVLIAAGCRLGGPASERDEEYPADWQQDYSGGAL